MTNSRHASITSCLQCPWWNLKSFGPDGFLSVALAWTLLITANTSLAISIGHDESPSLYFDLASQFPAVGRIDDDGFALCTGTLVDPTRVLTAAHCVDGVTGAEDNVPDLPLNTTTFLLGDDVANPTHMRGISAISVQTWDATASLDIALLTLSSPISDVMPIALSTLNPVGMVGTFVGFGEQGTGLSFPGPDDDLKRAAQNVVDKFLTSEDLVETDFGHPDRSTSTYGSATPLPLEGTTGAGDSGGPLFVDFGAGTRLVGVLNGGFNPIGDDSEYGDQSAWVSITLATNQAFLSGQGLSLVEPVTPGDFDGLNGVETQDLKLVLFNWDADGASLPSAWVNDRPPNGTAVGVDQLNLVLFNWASGTSALATVPEPSAWVLALTSFLLMRVTCHRQPLVTNHSTGVGLVNESRTGQPSRVAPARARAYDQERP